MQQLEEGGPDPLVFVLNANLLAMVKLVNCESLPFTLFYFTEVIRDHNQLVEDTVKEWKVVFFSGDYFLLSFNLQT